MATNTQVARRNLSSTLAATTTSAPYVERHQYGDPSCSPEVSIIVPTLDRHRRGLLDRLLEDLNQQTLARFEVLLVIGDRRQGRAINRGVREADASIVVTMDDDTYIGTPSLLANLVEVLRQNKDVGMVGASTVVPPGSSWFQRVASEQIPRRLFPVVDRIVDSDMVQHPCLAMPKSVFEQIGGEDEELKRGLDPLLRHKVRDAGYRVVIAPHTFISHPLPEGYWSVVRMYYRNGRGSAFAQRAYPDRVYNLSDGFQNNKFPAKVPFAVRALRYPLRMLRSVVTFKWIHLSVQLAYVMGYVREFVVPSYGKES